MKINITKIKESWIIDRIKSEWIENNKLIYSRYPVFSDLIWVIAPWSLNLDFVKKFKNKKIIYSQYHIEDVSSKSQEMQKLKMVEPYVDAFHVISLETKAILKKITDKPIYYLPLWVNQNIWFYIKDKDKLRNKYLIPKEDFLIGSFQRDTEGSDLISPKLLKGPDIFIQIVKNIFAQNKNLRIILTGTRRQYVISELKKLNIPFNYFEMADFEMTNELYNILDLYLITSRVEGGPQALVECGQTMTPIISTNVGIASQILAPESIFNYENIDTFQNAKPNIDFAYKQSSKLTIPKGMEGYNSMFKEVYES